jgi:hypothetical protein
MHKSGFAESRRLIKFSCARYLLYIGPWGIQVLHRQRGPPSPEYAMSSIALYYAKVKKEWKSTRCCCGAGGEEQNKRRIMAPCRGK